MIAIETTTLSRAFGKHLAVDDLNLSIPQGSVFGFLGPNGAGKTTTVRMLAALIAPTAGTAQVAGQQLGRDNRTIRQRVGILTETPGLYDRLNAMQNLMFFARLYKLDSSQASVAIEKYLQRFDLWERRNDAVGSFSKGMRQKLAIARALLHEPSIIFLDEPTAALDPEAARMVRDAIKNLRAEGRTIFLTTHNLFEAEELCDLVGIFRTRLLQLDTTANLRASHTGHRTRVRLNDEPRLWHSTVQALPFVQQVDTADSTLTITLQDPPTENPLLIQALVQAGAAVCYVEPLEESLEEIYLRLVGT